MFNYAKSLGDSSVMLELVYLDATGQGISGIYPTVGIRRQIDNNYYDFGDGTFKDSSWVEQYAPMTLLPQPGYFQYLWNSSSSVTSPSVYAIEFVNSSLILDMDIITFTEPADLEAKKMMYNKRVIDKTSSPYPIETLYDYDGTTVLGQWQLFHSMGEDSRLPL